MPLIVILDDRATNRNIYTRLAASLEEGVSVSAFADPLAALEWLAGHPPDLVITDYKMPKLDGAEFTRRFRALPAGADTPIIVITVYEDRNLRLRALDAGATDFLQSPVDHQEFLTRARNLLKLSKHQQLIKRRAITLERELQDSERSRQALLRESRERLAQVIDTIPAMISAADRDGRCVFVNAYQAALAGADPALAVAADAPLEPRDPERSRALDRMVFESGDPLPSFEEEIVDRAGRSRVFLTTKSPLRDHARRVVSVLTTSLDITERKQAESRLRHMAHHDSLTNLPNRALLQQRLQRELARGRRGDRSFALHFIDLDRFKGVNDVLGHHLGDRLLQAVAKRLAEQAREGDTVARLGGDEFAVLQRDVAREEAAALAGKVMDTLLQPFQVGDQEVSLSASIGITLSPADASGVDELLRNADLAMYRAKSEGRNSFRFYAEDMKTRAERAISLDKDLRNGLQRSEFVLHFQPQLDLRTGQIVGAEALLRWQRPGVGLLRPGEFLPFAEENGLSVPINAWVLHEACAKAVRWQQQGLPPLRWAVNLSPVQFRKQNVLDLVRSVLEQTGLDPSVLDVELTEGILVENAEAAAQVLRDLRDLGVGFSIDDFGAGYSSFSYVKNFPVDRIKIDQSFVRNLRSDPTDTAIVRAIISLGHSLHLQVIAEGVETVEQLTQLAAEGCDEIQGYYLSPPVELDEFERLLRARQGNGLAELPPRGSAPRQAWP
jgi:diguanylate cyclase (GGDEF)-like protein/PAS domain S-box-containing protein